MMRTHDEIRDLLEGYALWSLDDDERSVVEAHLAGCESCRATVRELETVVAAIPEAVAARAPSSRLRDRVLSAARGAAPRRRIALPPLRPAWALSSALLIVALASGGVAAVSQLEVQRVSAERDRYAAIVEQLSEGGRWWYMDGLDRFAGSGGTLVDPKKAGPAFVLFHDLRPVSPGTRYTIWLIRPDSSWVRAANFVPSGSALERVDVPLSVADFMQCAVTIESRDSGTPQGILAMQSRVFGQ